MGAPSKEKKPRVLTTLCTRKRIYKSTQQLWCSGTVSHRRSPSTLTTTAALFTYVDERGALAFQITEYDKIS